MGSIYCWKIDDIDVTMLVLNWFCFVELQEAPSTIKMSQCSLFLLWHQRLIQFTKLISTIDIYSIRRHRGHSLPDLKRAATQFTQLWTGHCTCVHSSTKCHLVRTNNNCVDVQNFIVDCIFMICVALCWISTLKRKYGVWIVTPCPATSYTRL